MRPARAILLGLAVLGACAFQAPGPPLPITARSLFDDYLLVHGMAAGSVQSAGIDRTQLLHIIQLDRQAIAAVLAAAGNSADALARAQSAIAALASYAATVSATAPQGPQRISRSEAP